MTLAGRRVLVTGAGGFIGSHLAERLVEEGAQVRAFVHYDSTGRWGWLDDSPLAEGMEIVAGDVADRDLVHRATRGVDVVFHLAALIGIPYSYQAPASYVRTNVEGTLNVLQAARDVGASRVVQTSTSEVYGSPIELPIREDHPLRGQSPYSATKIAADKLAEAFHSSFDLPVVTLRPFNTFGPRQSSRAVVPTIITQCLDGVRLRLGSLDPRRDLNFVANTVDGFVRAAVVPDAVGRTIHVGSGHDVSIRELVDRIASILGTSPQVEIDPDRVRPERSEVRHLVADNTFAETLLGWTPRVELEEGLRRTIDWIREHRDLYRTGTYEV